ncbi:hypothetical protein AMC75_03465 [Staphylococcus carnosus]|uniref:DUF1381 domain-containing protein n=1 Tax=Staphylococcus carnosus TaxID=1281 RepID=UPI0006ABAFC5|nr:DUF1381 domain-containing protein [Staphylococcus carnosus]KOR13950.1 hypothetical protein AMC75_03465 [Staphylococcus carnosus]
MQFLVRKTHHTTGEVFLDVTRAKENEEFIVVDAENKEDAKEKVTGGKSRLFDVKEIVLMSILPIWLFAGFIIFIFKFLL